MKKVNFDNPKLLSLDAIEGRLKIAFRGILFQYSNSETPLFESEDTVISSKGSTITLTISENLPQMYQIVEFLTEILAPNYDRLLLEFANKFKVIDGATVVQTPPSNCSIYINGEQAAVLRLWLNTEKQPHEIEIIPFQTEAGTILTKWVTENKRDILKTNIYVAGDLVRMVTFVKDI